jgi:hypothetical protein
LTGNLLKAALLVMAAVAAGCSTAPWRRDITEDSRLRRFSEAPSPLPLRVAAAEVLLPQAGEPDPEAVQEHHPIACDPAALLESVTSSLQAFQVFEELRPLKLPGEGDKSAKVMEEAWERGYDAVLSTEFRELEVFYDGVNGWYLPNIVNWLFLLVPSWWVKDEVYGARARFEVSLRSTRSGRLLYHSELAAEFKRSLNDFQRGWQLFGIFRVPASLGESNWRSVSRHLLPGLLREIQVQVVTALADDFRKVTLSSDFERMLETKLGVVIGISRHKDYSIPKLKYTEEDALSVYRFLTGPEGEGVPERNVRLLTNERASRIGILAALDYLADKSRTCDSAVIYFAGYGAAEAKTAGESGDDKARAYLVPYDADRGDVPATCVSFEELEQKVAKVKAREVVIILDTGFGGDAEARSLKGSGLRQSFQEILKVPGRFVLSSGQAGEGAAEVDDQRHGIFTFYLLDGLKGPADADGDGRVTLGELHEYLKAKVGEETEMEGSAQHPRLEGEGAAGVVVKGAR